MVCMTMMLWARRARAGGKAENIVRLQPCKFISRCLLAIYGASFGCLVWSHLVSSGLCTTHLSHSAVTAGS